MKYELAFATQQRLARRIELLGPDYVALFLRNVEECIEREFAAAEVRRKADNDARMNALRVAA